VSVGIVADYLEEGWPSMDLVAELALEALGSRPGRWRPVLLRPAMPRPAGRLFGGRGHNLDRALGRYVAYPRWLRRRPVLDRYHLTDHSYAHLVHALPARRTVVTCHDLDAFRCLLEPAVDPRPAWFRALARRILSGMRAAAHVVADSEAVREEILRHDLVPPARVTVVPLPAHPDFGPDADPRAGAELARILGPPAGIELLHVGSTAPRKRIPLLLEAFAAVAARAPDVRLLRVGGALAPAKRALARALGIDGRLTELPPLSRRVLAELYRRSALVVVPSEREGFGLPVLEAMACGTAVLATDLPVLREVGGDAVSYVERGASWGEALADELERLHAPGTAPQRRARLLGRAAHFSGERYAAGLAAALETCGSG
jgi:glycosyltransferase involved in cell wall biosynthesis